MNIFVNIILFYSQCLSQFLLIIIFFNAIYYFFYNLNNLFQLFYDNYITNSNVIFQFLFIFSGFGFVNFVDSACAQRAIDAMHDTELFDRKIRVEVARRNGGYEKTPGRYLGPPQASVKFNPRDDRRGGYDDRRGGNDDRRSGYDDKRGGYDDRRGGGGGHHNSRGFDDRRGGYDDRRGNNGGYDDRRGNNSGYDDRRGGGGYSDHRGRGGYDDRRGNNGGFDDRRGNNGGYDDRRGGDRGGNFDDRGGAPNRDGRSGGDRGYSNSGYVLNIFFKLTIQIL